MTGGTTFSYDTTSGRRWGYVHDVPAPDGSRKQRRRRGFATRREAAEALHVALGELRNGVVVDDRLTVGEFVEELWLPSIRSRGGGRRSRGTVSEATWDQYAKTLERYVLPDLGALRLASVTGRDLDRLYDQLETVGGRSSTGLAPKTIQNVHGVVSRAMKDAVRMGLLSRSPADLVAAPTADAPDMKVWTVEQLRAFLEHVAGDDLYAGWLLFATTGARRGEVAGLTWGDVDLDAGTVRVDWTLGHVGHALRWQPRPKTRAGERTMSLDPSTVAALRAHRVAQAETRLRAGEVWRETFTDDVGRSRTGLLWAYDDGSPIHPKTWYERFLRHTAAAGLPRIRLHDLRHTYATAALANATGWHDVKVLSERLGHAKIATTLDTYAHVLPAADQEAADTLARVILGQTAELP